MRVLQVLPSIASGSGGPVRSTLAACRALHSVDSEMHTTLATTDQRLGAAWRDLFEGCLPARMEVRVFHAAGRGAFTVSGSLVRWLWAHSAEYDIVVVRALFHPLSSAAAWAARQRRVPYLVVPHGTLSRYTFRHRRSWLKRAYFLLLDRAGLKGAAAVRFTTKAELAGAAVWVSGMRTSVIPHPFESTSKANSEGGSRVGPVLFLSRLHPVKGLDVLLPAFQHLRQRLPEVDLVLAGSGSAAYEAKIHGDLERFGLSRNVRMPGFVEADQKDRLISEASVFVLPSVQESFGMAVVEAMAAGLPVVISRGVGIWNEVKEAGAGLVVEREPKALADGLFYLLRHPEDRRRMGANGRELVRASFAPALIGEQLRDLYAEVSATRNRLG